MSLSAFIQRKDVAERLKPFLPVRPTGPRPTLVVPFRGTNAQRLGTAFDYLLRFELQRRRPDAEDRGWVAEHVPDLIYRKLPDGGSIGRQVLVEPDGHQPSPADVARRVRAVVAKARQAHTAYVSSAAPTTGQTQTVAAAAVRLAGLDTVRRAGKLGSDFEVASESDVSDLMALLAAVPFDRLVRPGRLILNPTFGDASRAVGGADADLITGTRLVDIKTTQKMEWQSAYLNQLLGYFLLIRQARAADPCFQEVNEVCLYFSRFAHLWTVPTAVWTERPDFLELERWWVAETARVYKRPSAGASRNPLQ